MYNFAEFSWWSPKGFYLFETAEKQNETTKQWQQEKKEIPKWKKKEPDFNFLEIFLLLAEPRYLSTKKKEGGGGSIYLGDIVTPIFEPFNSDLVEETLRKSDGDGGGMGDRG